MGLSLRDTLKKVVFSQLLLTMLMVNLTMPAFADDGGTAESDVQTAVDTQMAVLDLRHWDITNTPITDLTARWMLYWQTFLPPDSVEDSAKDHHKKAFITVPGTWATDADGPHKGDFTTYGYATFHLRVLLPDTMPDFMAIQTKRVQTAHRIFINGSAVLTVGEPGKNAETEEAHRHLHTGIFKTTDSRILDIIIHVSNFESYNSGGFLSPIKFGTADALIARQQNEASRDVFIVGSLMAIGFMIAGYVLISQVDREFLLVTAMCFIAAAYNITIAHSLLTIFPGFSWFWADRIPYMMALIAPPVVYQLLLFLFPSEANRWIMRTLWTIGIIHCLFFSLYTGPIPEWLMYSIIIQFAIVLIAGPSVLWKSFRRKRYGRWSVMAALCVIILTIIHDLIVAIDVGKSPYLAPYGAILMVVLLAFVIAERHRRINYTSDMLMAAIESSKDSVVIFDNKKRLLFWNRAFANLLPEKIRDLLAEGLPEKYLLQDVQGPLASILSRPAVTMSDTREMGQLSSDAVAVLAIGSGTVHLKNTWLQHTDYILEDKGRFLIFNDISDLKKEEAKLKKTLLQLEKANNHKSEFLSNMSHDLRTPLNAIIGFAQMIEQKVWGDLPDKYIEYAQDILMSGEHLIGIIGNIIDISKIEAGKLEILPENIDIKEEIKTCHMLAQAKLTAKDLHFSSTIDEDLSTLYADSIRFRQILINLIENAIKFTEPGGSITINVRRDENHIAVDVQDTGIGIAKEHLAMVLERFGQIRDNHLVSHEGLGLGLSIVSELMKLHGGTISVKSEPGTGSTFMLYFPIKDRI